jgi:beta-glucosidase
LSGSSLRNAGRGRAAAPGRLRAATVAVITAAAGLVAAGPGAVSAPAASSACPWVDSPAPIATRVSQLMAQMTLAQEISLMTGVSGSYVGNTPAISALCIPAMNLEDGPAGVGDGMSNVTQLPAPVDVAATWDTSAEQEYGQVIGAEQAAKGSTVDLGPTINIVRDPRWGRAFESIGEDPYLAGQLSAADIRGVQSTGTMAQVKHFAVYNQETNRNTSSDNAVVSTQAEQEIYLPAFQAAVQQGAASSVMCSYSYINGTAACQNPYLLGTVLRQQFGFTGFVTSDWGATHSTAASANAGLDMDMPGSDGYYGSALQSAVGSGSVSQSTINTAVSQILTEMFGFGLFDKSPTGSTGATATNATDQADALNLAEEGTTLLKNSGSVLPLTSSDSSIAVIGADASTSPYTDGGGSAGVDSSGTVTPLQGIQAAAPSGTTVTYNAGTSDSSAASTAAAAGVAVVFENLGESEGSDLTSIDLGTTADNLISAVAAANPNTIVVLNTGSAVTMPWLSSVKGVLEAWYPGQEDGTAIANVLFGSYDPSGHLTVTFPTSLSQVPASTTAEWPGTGGNVDYNEGIDVGYRWYDQNNLTPLFPFGYGLSYTSFSFSNLQVGTLPQGGDATVTATVTNTGTRSGADVAQLYVTDPSASGQPPRQLEGFARVNLAAGASTTVTFPLSQQNLQYWNASSNAWATSTGTYGIEVGDGDSTATLPLSGSLTVAASQLGAPVAITAPGPQESIAGSAVSVAVTASDSTSGQTPTFSATGLPSGLSISSSGTVSGTPTTAGTSTVTVTAKDGDGAQAGTSFVWTVAPAPTPEGPYGGTPAAVPGTVQAENYDTGGQGVAYSVATVNGTDNAYRSDGVDLETTTDTGGGNDLGWTATGQWFNYTVDVATAGTYTVGLRYAAPSAVTDGLHIANASGTNLSGSVSLAATGGWQDWATADATVTLPAGVQTLTVYQDNGGWNLHNLAFTLAGGSTEAPYGGTAAAVPGTVQAENYDTGGQGVAYNVASVNGSANSYRSDGVDLEATTDTGGGDDLGWTAAGQWFKYTVSVAGAGTYAVSFRLAAPSAVTDGLHLANSAGTNLSGDINIPATGGYQDWTTVTADVTLPAGTQTLTLDQDNGGWNINYATFAATGGGGINTSDWYEVVNQNSGLCASSAGGATANGTAVEQLACTGATSQLWQFVPVATGEYEVLNDNAQSEAESWNITGGVTATASGDLLQTWDYGGTTNTNELFAANLQSSGNYTFTVENDGLCIDVPSASTASGTQLQQYTCNSTTAQAFTLIAE